jgi:uncharacterized protein (TIGR02996 family)
VTANDERAFLSAILANPDDDTPRLVLADWLDERGSEDDRARAALIRAQCRLEHLPAAGRERRALAAEIREILRKNYDRWTEPLRTARLGTDWTFQRGFLEGGSMSATLFVQRGADLFRLAPTLRAMRFPNAANETTELAESPHLARLAALDLTLMCTCGYCAIGDELRDLFKSKHAANLRCLNVSRDRMNSEGVAALGQSKVLANLTELDLSRNPLSPDGARAITGSKHLGRLMVLSLAGTGLYNLGAQALAGAKNLPSLTRLDLSGNEIGATGAVALARSALFKRLRVINLANNRIGVGGATALAQLPEDVKLELLDVRKNELSESARARLKKRFGKKVKL